MDPHSRNNSVREMKSMKQGVPLSRAISPRKRDSTSMASEYLVLTDIACNLSTYVQNRASSSSHQSQPRNKNYKLKKPFQDFSLSRQGANSNAGNLDEVAKLLLNLKEVIPQPEALELKDTQFKVADIATDISPSLSFEASRHYQRHTSSQPSSGNDKKNVTFLNASPQQCDSERTFSFRCPSLSLVEEDNEEEHNHHHPHNHPVSVANENMKTKPTSTPSQLFSRSFTKQSTLNVSSIAESLASNLMQSFISALEWRTKVWTRDLTRSLSSKFNEEAMKLDKRQSQKRQSRKKGQSEKSSLDQLKQKFKKSQEARVIQALAQTRSSIIVHDVRTSFFVLEQQQQTKDGEKKKDDFEMQNHTFDQSDVFRPLKKRRTVTDDLTKIPVKVTNLDRSRYTLSHALNLESQCSVSISSDKKISVSLQTPGVIHGTFVRNDDGDVTLVEMSISLDTQNLAYSMEQKSRFVVRTAAEECIISPPYSAPPLQQPMTTMEPVSDEASSDNGFTNTSFEKTPRSSLTTKSYSPTQSFVTPNTGYGDNALVTPHYSEYFTASDSDEMPPPPPRLPMETNNSIEMRTTSYLNPRRVSPTSEAITVSTMTTKGDYFKKLVSPVPKEDTTLDMSPPLVSPYLEPTAGGSEKLMAAHLDREGPALPVLVEVACAAHTMCK